MSFFLLEPYVAGGLGDNTVMDTSIHPPIVSRLHYTVDDWAGDELLESTPCFIITQHLASIVDAADLSGYRLADVEVTLSDTGTELLGDTELPTFRWLQVTGTAGTDDFGVTSDASIVVSTRALDTLRTGNIDNCDIEAWDDSTMS